MPFVADALLYTASTGSLLLTLGVVRYLAGRILDVAGWLADASADDVLFKFVRAVREVR